MELPGRNATTVLTGRTPARSCIYNVDHHILCVEGHGGTNTDSAPCKRGEYSIADMICWPWVLIAKPLGASLEAYPNVTRWRAAIKDRPAVQRAVDLGKEFRRSAPPDDAERRILFTQSGASVTR